MSLAIRTLAHLRQHHDARLTLLGDGEERTKLTALSKKLGLTEHVHMPGFIDDIMSALAEADLLLITSRYEGGPATAVEALACGTPIVSTDCSYFLRDIVTAPSLGTLVNKHSAAALAEAVLAQMATAPASQDELTRAVEASRNSHSAQQYLKLFDKAAGLQNGRYGTLPKTNTN